MKRDVAIILGVCVVAIIVGAVLFFVDTPILPHTSEAVVIKVLSEGTDAQGMDTRKNYRIMNAEQLEEVWAFAHGSSVEALPQVDFKTQEVLAVFDGKHPTGGYSVEITTVVDSGNTRKITIVHTSPGTGCVTTEALTNPFQIVVVPKTDNTIDRNDENATVACN